MNKERGNRETGGEPSRPQGETARGVRGFFERASERAREAARDIGQRMRGRDRDRDRGMYDDRDEGWFGRHDRDRTLNRGGMMGRDQGYGGREPQYYGDQQFRSREHGYGMRDDYQPRMYGGREHDRDWRTARDDRDRDYERDFGRHFGREHHRDYGRDDDRGIRANFGGGYGMRDERGTMRDPMGNWGNDRDREDDRWSRNDRNRDRRW